MTIQRCPKCNEPYPAGSASCPHCAAPLVRVCPTCGARRPWSVPVCPHCASTADDARLFTSLFQQTPGERIKGRYAVQGVLATGNTGRVLRALDRHDGDRPVAIKEIALVRLFRADERRESLASLNRQVERWRGVQHAALPGILDNFEANDRFNVVMELVSGWTGARILGEKTVAVTPELARNWGAQLCELLRVLHRQEPPLDVSFLSPDHLMVTPDGQVKLVGLGLGRFVAPTLYGPYGSTTGYAAPELEASFPSPRSDVFAVGRLLYALLIGVDLAKGMGRAVPLQRAVPGISTQLVKAIARAAHRDLTRRYASARQLGRALWDETYGPLAPIQNWYQSARRAPDPDAPLRAPAHTDASGQSMEDLGFAADDRFGKRPAPAAQAPGAPALKPAAKGVLSVQPHHFEERDLKASEKRRLVLTLRNVGEVDVTGRFICHVSWLSAPSKGFTVPAGKQAKVLLSIDGGALPAGKTVAPQALSLDSSAGSQWIGIAADVATGPQLAVEPERFDLGVIDTDAAQRLTLTISNAGRQLMSGAVGTRAPWLRVDRPDFRCPPGRTATISITCLPERLPKGPQVLADALVIESDGGQRQVEVRAWRRRPVLELGATHMDLGALQVGEVAERYLILGNTGDGPLEGSVRSLAPWLQAFPREFTVEPGELVPITVTADLTGVADGPVDIIQALRVQSNGGSQSMSLHAVVSAPRLVVSRDVLSFGAVAHGQVAELALRVGNSGAAPLELGIISLAPWLSCPTEQLSLAPGQFADLRLLADTRHFSQGQIIQGEPGLRLTQSFAMRDLPAELTVIKPALRVEPEICDFGYIDPATAEHRAVTISNDGNGRLAWTATSAAPWVELAPAEGVCPPGQSQTIELAAYGLMLPLEAESDESSLVITSDGGRAKVALRIAKAHPLIAADTALLELGPSVNRQPVAASLRLFNHGLGLLRGSIRASEPWLALERVSFECATGRSTEIVVRADMAELPDGDGDFEAALLVESNGGQLVVDVFMHVELAPALEAPDEIAMAAAPEGGLEGRLTLRNAGLAPAHVTLRALDEGIELSRDQADIKPDRSVRIKVSAVNGSTGDWRILVGCGGNSWTISAKPVQ